MKESNPRNEEQKRLLENHTKINKTNTMEKNKHTNRNIPFSRGLKKDILERMEARYELPQDESHLYYDESKDIAFVQKPNGFRMVCTLRKENLRDTLHNSHSRDRS